MNASLVPIDRALPQLPVALDAHEMAQVFADVLRPAGVRVERCTLDRVKYRPGRNATLGYRLDTRDDHERRFVQVVAARLCSGDGAARTMRAGRESLVPSRAGPALRWLPDLDMLTWWWPNDAKLRATRALSDLQALRSEVLPELRVALGANSADLRDAVVVQYVPEQRVTARVDLTGCSDSAVYAKASLEPEVKVAHDVHVALSATSAAVEGRLRTPRALLVHAGTGTWWQQAMPGRPMLDVPRDLARACAAPLGGQLAALHGCAAAPRLDDHADVLRERLRGVVEVLERVLEGPGVRAAARAIEARWILLGKSDVGCLHGDFHARNILVDGPGGGATAAPTVSLIDLDGLRRGPVVLELGAWIADAIYRAMLEGEAFDRDRAAWQEMLAAYVDAGGQKLDIDVLRWATAWNLLTQRAWRCVVNLKPGRWDVAPRLVALAASLARGGDHEEGGQEGVP